MKKTTDNLTLLIDGKYLIYRSSYSSDLGNLTHNDIKTGIYYGFLNSLKSVIKKFPNTKKVYLLWDIFSKEKQIRSIEYKEYKVKRNKQETSPEDKKLKIMFHQEYEKFIGLCDGFGFSKNVLPRYEADDLFGLYCEQYPKENIVMITRDEDMYQLLSDNISLYSPDDKILKTKKWLHERYNLIPSDWVLYKQIVGCKSDCVPGIVGVGEKRFIQYMEGKASEKIQAKIEANKDIIERNYDLVKLPHPSLKGKKFKFTPIKIKGDNFLTFCQIYGLRSFIEEIDFWEKVFK